jgi:hypothetical protein
MTTDVAARASAAPPRRPTLGWLLGLPLLRVALVGTAALVIVFLPDSALAG